MPYIVITKRENRRFGEPGCVGVPNQTFTDVVSRRAVATPEDARLGVRAIVVDAALALGTTQNFPPAHLSSWAEEVITESGGTVGPLPDGTEIQVEPTRYGALAEAILPDRVPFDDEEALLAAYNAAQMVA